MYLRTISTQPYSYIEGNFTLNELDANVDINMSNRLVDDKRKTTTTVIKDYNTTTNLELEV